MNPSENSSTNSFRLVPSRVSCPDCNKTKFTKISSRDFYSMVGKMISSRRCCIIRAPVVASKMENGNQLETKQFRNQYEKYGRNASFTLISSKKIHNLMGRAISSRLTIDKGSLPTKSCLDEEKDTKIEDGKIRWFKQTMKPISIIKESASKLTTIREEQEDGYGLKIDSSMDVFNTDETQMNLQPKINEDVNAGYVKNQSKEICQGSSLANKSTPPRAVIPSTKKKKNRCLKCSKNVRLNGITCKCKGLFCSIHRYTDKHECTYDWKADGAEEIARNNPLIIGKKISKI